MKNKSWATLNGVRKVIESKGGNITAISPLESNLVNNVVELSLNQTALNATLEEFFATQAEIQKVKEDVSSNGVKIQTNANDIKSLQDAKDIKQWNSTDTYKIGQIVIDEEVFYVALTENTNKKPILNPRDWESADNFIPVSTTIVTEDKGAIFTFDTDVERDAFLTDNSLTTDDLEELFPTYENEDATITGLWRFNGRIFAKAPVSSGEVAIKSYVDAVKNNVNILLTKYDVNIRSKVAGESAGTITDYISAEEFAKVKTGDYFLVLTTSSKSGDTSYNVKFEVRHIQISVAYNITGNFIAQFFNSAGTNNSIKGQFAIRNDTGDLRFYVLFNDEINVNFYINAIEVWQPPTNAYRSNSRSRIAQYTRDMETGEKVKVGN